MQTLKNKVLLISLIGLSILLLGCNSTTKTENVANSRKPKPNIVLFFVDDLGWADLGYRNKAFESPNIDQLASEGLDFQNTYVATATCSPSRAALLTGKHPARLEFFRHIPNKFKLTEKYNFWPKDPAQVPSINWLEKDYVTYAEALKELGYYNAFFGKWHLGHEGHHPVDQGFDLQVGTTNWGNPLSYNAPFFRAGTKEYQEVKQGYLTDKLTEDAVQFIDSYQHKKPFTLSMWYYHVHSPYHGRKDLVEHFQNQGLSGKQAIYAAMVKSVDMSVGRIRQALQKKGISDNTIVLFLSDQGGAFSNAPLRGGKYEDTLYEGGSRVPFIVKWPGVTKPDSTNASLIQTTDIFPTLIEIAGGSPDKYKPVDGVSLVATIKENSFLKRNEPLFGYRAYYDTYATVRLNDWKLIAFRSGETELYNIANDVSETTDLSKAHPERVKSLTEALFQWEKEMSIDQYSGYQTNLK